MEKVKPLILISNDDGYHAKGLLSLIDMLQPMARLLVCAPDSARSGYACAFSATTPLRLKLRRQWSDVWLWSCSGTPVDCVKLALHDIVPREPDLVVSGINHGDNASINVHYSGTLGAAIEGALHGIKSVAFSSCNHNPQANLMPLKPYVESVVKAALENSMPPLTCLNVNFPALSSFNGVRICRMGHCRWINEFERCDVEGRGTFYFLTGNYTDTDPGAKDTDSHALAEGYVAVTPTTLDVTSHRLAEEVKNWGIEQ